MPTLEPLHGSAANSFAYFGDREGWLVALSVNRDSDALDRSNWDAIAPEILATYPTDAVIERMGHWACGWIDYLLVRPETAAATAAQVWADRLAGYPVADEEAYSALEYAEEWCVRCDRGTREQHDGPTWDRFRSEEDAREIVDRWRYRRSA